MPGRPGMRSWTRASGPYENGPDSIEFQQEVSGPSGYAYVYRKTVRLSPGRPEMVLEHSLKNTGRQLIETPVYEPQLPGDGWSAVGSRLCHQGAV